jgi:hypothetical protein
MENMKYVSNFIYFFPIRKNKEIWCTEELDVLTEGMAAYLELESPS